MPKTCRRRCLRWVAAGAIGVSSSSWAQFETEPGRLDSGGVDFAEELLVDGTRLIRNGVGTRYRFVVRVYAAALYTPEPVRSAPEALDLRQARILRVVMLRDIEGADLGRLLTHGMRANASREEMGRALPGILRLGELFAEKKRLLKGESFMIQWLPRIGTRILINDRSAGPAIAETAFFSALLKIWIGPSPADERLKQALLVGPTPP
jgi:Chalcone isomerase-like